MLDTTTLVLTSSIALTISFSCSQSTSLRNLGAGEGQQNPDDPSNDRNETISKSDADINTAAGSGPRAITGMNAFDFEDFIATCRKLAVLPPDSTYVFGSLQVECNGAKKVGGTPVIANNLSEGVTVRWDWTNAGDKIACTGIDSLSLKCKLSLDQDHSWKATLHARKGAREKDAPADPLRTVADTKFVIGVSQNGSLGTGGLSEMKTLCSADLSSAQIAAGLTFSHNQVFVPADNKTALARVAELLGPGGTTDSPLYRMKNGGVGIEPLGVTLKAFHDLSG